jgi:hypothetical protein
MGIKIHWVENQQTKTSDCDKTLAADNEVRQFVHRISMTNHKKFLWKFQRIATCLHVDKPIENREFGEWQTMH